jgi:hypothetical protein
MFSCWSTVVREVCNSRPKAKETEHTCGTCETLHLLGFFWTTCGMSGLWMPWVDGMMLFVSKIFEILKENNDVLLMHFWDYIILIHFRCSFIGFWCTFDVVSKVHQKCIMFFRVLQIFLENFAEMLRKHYALLMHWWCAFETTSKVHQNPMKLNQKCIQMM